MMTEIESKDELARAMLNICNIADVLSSMGATLEIRHVHHLDKVWLWRVFVCFDPSIDVKGKRVVGGDGETMGLAVDDFYSVLAIDRTRLTPEGLELVDKLKAGRVVSVPDNAVSA